MRIEAPRAVRARRVATRVSSFSRARGLLLWTMRHADAADRAGGCSVSYRALAWVPFVFAAVFAIAALAAGEHALAAVLTTQNETGKVLGMAGALAAALAFERDDYLRRAWLFNAAGYALLLAGDAAGVHTIALRLTSHQLDFAQGTIALLANAASVLGTWMLARAWNVAGLEDDDASRARTRWLFAAGAVIALTVTGWPLVRDARALLGGDLGASVDVVSDLGDTACLALVAPVMQTALAMRGGVLRWPWGLLATSLLAWLAYDAASSLIDPQVAPARWVVAAETVRALACAYAFAAGLAQRRAVAPQVGEQARAAEG